MSNIAWSPEEETEVADLLRELDVHQVEIAPTKVFPDPTEVSGAALDGYIDFWRDRNVSIVAFQSMLFGRPDLQVFDSGDLRRETFQRLASFVNLAGRMGVRALVFGSPKNRVVPGSMSSHQAMDIAVPFFRDLGRVAEDAGTIFCIEPNPAVYGCNFVNTAAEGFALVSMVDTPGFRLHLDAAGMTLAGDNLTDAISSSASMLTHFHVSAPQLGELEEQVVDHSLAAAALTDTGYTGTLSIEMRSGAPGEASRRVRDAVALARRHYPVAQIA
ncbi:sugar phosphate isomerase/epimerase family protein [Glaciihabitans tibetensis]|uniref:sugar phosphate isomerase/epimerase family protein n=1 Tax=Glaciihabitans tibetensis TaxID=1266600 RepID=UPI0015E7DCC2|nr:TIM barrel protein [Glaciihabitans tibetensis]